MATLISNSVTIDSETGITANKANYTAANAINPNTVLEIPTRSAR